MRRNAGTSFIVTSDYVKVHASGFVSTGRRVKVYRTVCFENITLGINMFIHGTSITGNANSVFPASEALLPTSNLAPLPTAEAGSCIKKRTQNHSSYHSPPKLAALAIGFARQKYVTIYNTNTSSSLCCCLTSFIGISS